MKERGLLMTPVNYGRCKDGSKTQTRRIITPQPHVGISSFHFLVTGFKPSWSNFEIDHTNEDNRIIKCPYGVPGDRLYVKEGWCPRSNGALLIERVQKPFYRIGDGEHDMAKPKDWKWRSPLFMPKWAARLWLELTDVRVERLHEISSADVRAEGVEVREFELFGADNAQRTHIHRLHFKQLWESNAIHKPGSWDLNPWLWCLTFTKVRHE